MKDLAGFLLDSAHSAVYAAPASVAALKLGAEACGLVCFDLDLAGVADKAAFLRRCQTVFGLPPTFGYNWDALADCLQDLSWRPARGYAVFCSRGAEFARRAPHDFAIALDIFTAAAAYWRAQHGIVMVLLDPEVSANLKLNSLPGPVATAYKIPISVLALIHTPDLQVLLLERADRPGFWQSVTGSQNEGETLRETAAREVKEETGLEVGPGQLVDWGKQNLFEIYPHWRARYAPGVTHNTEHVFSLQLPQAVPVTLAEREHLQYVWLPWRDAADKVFSWTNAQAIRELPQRLSPAVQDPGQPHDV